MFDKKCALQNQFRIKFPSNDQVKADFVSFSSKMLAAHEESSNDFSEWRKN